MNDGTETVRSYPALRVGGVGASRRRPRHDRGAARDFAAADRRRPSRREPRDTTSSSPDFSGPKNRVAGRGDSGFGTGFVRDRPRPRAGFRDDARRIPEGPPGQRVFGGRSPRVLQRSTRTGRNHERSTPARMRRAIAIRNAMPIPRQERAVTGEDRQA